MWPNVDVKCFSADIRTTAREPRCHLGHKLEGKWDVSMGGLLMGKKRNV